MLSFIQKLSFLFLIAGLSLAIRPLQAQSSDDYLKQLDSEASDLSLDRKTHSTENPARARDMRSATGVVGVPANGEDQGLPPGLTQDAFEQALKQHYMGSYIFYRRLNQEDRLQLYRDYQQDPDPIRLRQKILNMLKHRRGK